MRLNVKLIQKHFYNHIDNNCEYYTDDQFNHYVQMNGALSVIHFNSQSLYRNFSKNVGFSMSV